MGDSRQIRIRRPVRLVLWAGLVLLLTLLATVFPERQGLPVALLEDPDSRWTLDEVKRQPSSAWQAQGTRTVNKGYSRSTFWLRLDLPQWQQGARFLGIGNPLLEHIVVHVQRSDGHTQATQHVGAARPFGERPLPFVSFVVPLEPADSGATLWLQVSSRTSVQVPLDWWDGHGFARHQQQLSLFHGSYLGVILAMLV